MAVTTAEVRETGYIGTYSAVHSRVSWGAILAGATVALAVYFLLNLLGVAIGLSVADNVETNQLGIGAAIWSFVSLIVALFLGGWVTTQCTTGENRTEAMLYGVIVWAVTSTLLVWLTATGLGLSYHMLRAAPGRSGMGASASEIERIGRQAGLSDNEISRMQQGLSGNTSADDANNPDDANMDRTKDNARAASWWAFGGTLLSMLAAIAGALVGPYEVVLRRGYVATTTTTTGRLDR